MISSAFRVFDPILLTILHCGGTVRNNTHQFIAAAECLSSDGSQAVRKGNDRQAAAVVKHPASDLRQSVRKKNGLNEEETIRIVKQVGSALSFMHSKGMLHLDLKPDNILLTHINDDVKLIDLGFCRTDAFVDTQGYTSGFAAPEQLSSGEVDVRTDIYAFGKILEHLPNHSLYKKVIARCTAEHPEARYQSVEEILYDINHRRRYYHYVAAFAAIGAVLAIGIVLLTHRETAAPVIQETPADSVVQMVNQGNQGDGSLDSARQNHEPVFIPPQSPKKDEQTLCKEEMARLIDKAYHSTIYSFRDSLFPPPVNYPGNPWADASTAFHDQVVQIGDRLVKKYPNIPESFIRQETEMRFQGLVTYVFNQMRTNAQ